MKDSYHKYLNQFSPISLLEMERVALMDRTDTKFILNKNQLKEILKATQNQYYSLVVNEVRDSKYQSLYLDTNSHKFYKRPSSGQVQKDKNKSKKIC